MSTTDIQPATGDERPPGPPATSPDEQRSAFVRLALIVLAAVVAAAVTGVTKTALVVLAIIVMIMLHELGHFVTAKAAGMKVTEYFLGFGPKLWSVRRGETEYGVKAIPAGGYVKIIGMSNLEEVPPEDEPRTYRQKPYWRRMSVAVAGSTVHFIIALLLVFILVSFVGLVRYDRPTLRVGEISRLASGPSPAQLAGFELGDRIVSVDGHAVASWDEIPPYIQKHAGEQLEVVVERDGKQVTLTPTPVDLQKVRVASSSAGPAVSGDQPFGFVGIGPSFPVERAGPLVGAGRAFSVFGSQVKGTLGALGHLVTLQGISSYGHQLTGKPAATTDPAQPRFLSPVGFVRVASEAADTGLREVLVLLVAINVFVGIFNLIPLLPLDGGHVAIATYERLRSHKGRRYHADVAKLMPITYGVFLLLMFIGISSLYLDIVRPVSNPFQ